MNLLLILNNVSSVALVIACWWLAHAYAAAGRPHGRLISALLGVFGISVAATAFARNLQVDPNPFIVLTKIVLVALFVTVSHRVSLNTRRRHDGEPA